MNESPYPLPEHESLVSRVSETALPQHHRRWNGNDASQRNHNGVVSLDDDPLYLRLAWRRSSSAPAVPVGCFRLDLRQLLAEGYGREEPNHPGHIRLRFYHADDGVIYIQVNRSGPALAVGRVGATGSAGEQSEPAQNPVAVEGNRRALAGALVVIALCVTVGVFCLTRSE